jgi:hypothetical protein
MPQSRYLTMGGLTPAYQSFETRGVRLEPNVTLPNGTIMSEVLGYGIFTPYLPGMVASCILQYDCKTDQSGRVWYYLAFGTDERPIEKAQAFFRGFFFCETLVGLDENAIANLGRLIEGNVSSGILRMG